MEIQISETGKKLINVSSRFYKHGTRYFYKLCNRTFAVEVYYNEERPQQVQINVVKISDAYQSGWEPVSESDFKEILDIAEDAIKEMLTDPMDLETELLNQEAETDASKEAIGCPSNISL